MDFKEISDTLSAAKIYLNHLKSLSHEIANAEKQIINTFEETEKNIYDTFSNLKKQLIDILNQREKILLSEAEKVKKESLVPLEECRTIILEKIGNTNKLIKLGNDSLSNGHSSNLETFSKEASLLGSLPEVPELKEVAFLSFNFEPSLESCLRDVCSSFGEVCRISPVQISSLSEKPGAILVEWQSVENEDRHRDIQEFRLQRAFGNVLKEKHLKLNFLDCYTGLDTQYLVKDLQIFQAYSFRVCCKFEGSSDWSPWSLPQVCKTSLEAFSWKETEGFELSNGNKIAKSLRNGSPVLLSSGPQFCVGHSVEFTILEIGQNDAVLGLIVKKSSTIITDLKKFENSFLLDKNGHIFIDGVQKLTKLPEFSKNLIVSFTCEQATNKIRVNIDSSDKRVTYDWMINTESQLFFACQFSSANWKIMVE